MPNEEVLKCEECGREIKHFVHNCNINLIEIYGCPYCDDKCAFCNHESEKLSDNT